jgi:uncharacterized protein with von Willebrand factor type A (vWA) domain
LRATAANVAYMVDFINRLQANGQTDFYSAFKEAFDLLKR